MFALRFNSERYVNFLKYWIKLLHKKYLHIPASATTHDMRRKSMTPQMLNMFRIKTPSIHPNLLSSCTVFYENSNTGPIAAIMYTELQILLVSTYLFWWKVMFIGIFRRFCVVYRAISRTSVIVNVRCDIPFSGSLTTRFSFRHHVDMEPTLSFLWLRIRFKIDPRKN